MESRISIPEIPEQDKNPTVEALLDIVSQCIDEINRQSQQIRQLKDEIAKLKGGNPKPKISASKMDSDLTKRTKSEKKKRGKKKKKKTKKLKINRTIKIQPSDVPEGSKFLGYKDYIVQDIIFSPDIIRYRRGKWKTPEGNYIFGQLPNQIQGHYGVGLKQFILYLNYDLNVPQTLIYNSLREIGIEISTGEINNILINDKELFHTEKELLLETGLKISPYVNVDDTGARHAGKNGYCTHIGNEFFAYFKSTSSKSRINFLELLRGKYCDYVMDIDAMNYIEARGLAESKLERLKGATGRKFTNKDEWEFFLKMIGIRNEKHVRIVTEGALIGSILSHDINKDIVIVSDDAGQFEVFALLHALCWIHAERKINEIIPINDYQSKIIKDIRDKFWKLYAGLKEYKKFPDEIEKIKLAEIFEEIFCAETEFEVINRVLKRIYRNKKELLLVLERPDIPLHNNASENDIRIFVTKRKVHGGTRSEDGKRCRDTFMSLKKRCRKLGISFYDYLHDRLSGMNSIPQLHEIMKNKAFEGT